MLRRSRSLTSRIAAASLLLGFVVVLAFALLASSIQSLRGATRAARRSGLIVAAADRLEKLAVDMETGERGFLIARDDLFLEPYEAAIARYPADVRALEQLVASQPEQHARVLRIARALRAYQLHWAAPVIALARVNPRAAIAREAGEGGKRRVDAIRTQFAQFIARENELSAKHTSDSNREGLNALILGVLCAIGSALLIVIYAGYLLRLVVAPVRRVAEAARRRTHGDLSARVAENGVGEVAVLAHNFNSMADTLQANQDNLAFDNAKLEAVLNATLDGILMTDADGNILFSNRKMDQLWKQMGLRDEGTIWDRMLRLAQRTTTPDAYFDLFAELAANPDKEIEADFTLADDGRSFIGYTAPVQHKGQARVGRIFAVREVTEERAVQRLKDEFVATVSHELRTPLTSIVGYVELLFDQQLSGALNETQQEFVDVIGRNAERLQRLVADLLFFAQVEAERLTLEYTQVDLVALVERARASAHPVAQNRGVSLECNCAGSAEIEADESRIAQLVDNLVSNALKFTPAGGCVRLGVQADDGLAAIEVRDDGIGIPEAEVERLFQRFFRASSAVAEEIPGTGLGLAIAKTIVDAHGGSIDVSSSPGKGTTVCVRLPVERVRTNGADRVTHSGVGA